VAVNPSVRREGPGSTSTWPVGRGLAGRRLPEPTWTRRSNPTLCYELMAAGLSSPGACDEVCGGDALRRVDNVGARSVTPQRGHQRVGQKGVSSAVGHQTPPSTMEASH
jgi:hypothetical protein